MDDLKDKAEAEDDFEKRKDAFITDYGGLVNKHQADWAPYPVWVPDSEGMFKVRIGSQVVDMKKQAVKSPFVAT